MKLPFFDKLRPVAHRMGQIISAQHLPGAAGKNINGPSLIRMPEWAKGKLGRYHLYFAHHSGSYIRLAYAENLNGPWHIHSGGTLALKDCPGVRNHLASPDVHIDHDSQVIRLFFHAPIKGAKGQQTFLAESKDGLTFTVQNRPLGNAYFRAWCEDGAWYALAGARLYRSKTDLNAFEEGPPAHDESTVVSDPQNPEHIRHTAVHRYDNKMYVFFTRKYDKPERILCSRLDTTASDWRLWRIRGETEILRPRTEYEGGKLPLTQSQNGAAKNPERALRDPCIYVEDGDSYLLYSVAGEQGIALSKLDMSRIAARLPG